MNARSWRLGLLLILLCASPAAAESPWSTEEFLGRRKEWEKFLDTSIKVEGRVLAFNKQQLRLQRCDVVFHLGENHAGRVTSSRRVEMRGRLRKVDDKIGFYVDDLQGIPSDHDEFQSRDSRINPAKSEDYYALADWATGRATFYEDRELKKQAMAIYRKGVETEAHGLPPDDVAGRYALATKAVDYGIAELGDRLTFEGGLIESRSALGRVPPNAQELSTVAADLARRLPGAQTPLATIPADLAARFAKDPLEAWRRSTPAEQPILQRLLWGRIQTARITLDAEADGRNGREISERLKRIVPEEADLALKYDDQYLKYRVERASGLTRPELVGLAEELAGRKKPDEARQAIVTWLKAREPRWREEGSRGLVTLANERLALLKDEPGAVALLIEAADQNPEVTEAATRLQSMGYAHRGGRWQRASTLPDRPIAPEAPAPAGPDSLQVGLSAQHLRQMLGEPTSRSRIATGQGITESWAYGLPGTTRLVVVLQRKFNDRELKVSAFSSTDASRRSPSGAW
ncbi:hypothetical protein [Planctellipticum variicoloris]|uniref:hypothetical protein n=1 Tax=Planctellipticum variicoloris TaxID=3064265 RepID=UPI00301327DD|nr:hypothetical protein SH412_001276 [Planctomycetaceae bacterium SH412]